MKKTILPGAFFIVLLFVTPFFYQGCSVYQTAVNISRLSFDLGAVNNVRVAGVSLEGKSRLEDFSALDLLSFAGAVVDGSLPLDFTLNVNAENPNDGTGGYPKTNATITSFPYRLMINQKEVLRGNIDNPVSVPGTGEIETIPLSIGFDLVKMFEDKSYEGLVNLALKLKGDDAGDADLQLFAQPVVRTAIGDIAYPNEIQIVRIK